MHAVVKGLEWLGPISFVCVVTLYSSDSSQILWKRPTDGIDGKISLRLFSRHFPSRREIDGPRITGK